MKLTSVLLSLLVFTILVMISCQHEIQFPKSGTVPDSTVTTNPPPPPPPLPPPIPGSSCSADTVYFTNTILPLLNSNCAMSGCHDGKSGGDAGEYTLNTYAGIRAITRPGNPSNSVLVSVISSGQMPPQGHTPISSTQLAAIETWISQGALNNSCTSTTCDTTHVTYSISITGILQNYCTGCHSGTATAGGGIDLTTYANVLTQVRNGRLWGDVSHAAGFNAMPLGGASLSACDLNIINAWITQGAPNN